MKDYIHILICLKFVISVYYTGAIWLSGLVTISWIKNSKYRKFQICWAPFCNPPSFLTALSLRALKEQVLYKYRTKNAEQKHKYENAKQKN